MAHRRFRLLHSIAISSAYVLLLCVAIIALIVLLEEKLIYFPSKYPEGRWNVDRIVTVEGRIFPKTEDCYFTTADGIRLHGWYCVPQEKKGQTAIPVSAEAVLLWFHGNAGNVTHRLEMIAMLIEIPVDIFIIDYRGYGRSDGSPSEKGLYLDARAAWDYLVGRRKVDPRAIIIFGKSLGAVPAIDLASRIKPAGLIVQSGFTSLADMAATIFPFIPRFILRTKMDSASKIRDVTCRKLFIHSPADEVVPYRLGRRLFELAPEPKQFYEVSGAPHNETYLAGGEEYCNALRRFIAACRK